MSAKPQLAIALAPALVAEQGLAPAPYLDRSEREPLGGAILMIDENELQLPACGGLDKLRGLIDQRIGDEEGGAPHHPGPASVAIPAVMLLWASGRLSVSTRTRPWFSMSITCFPLVARK